VNPDKGRAATSKDRSVLPFKFTKSEVQSSWTQPWLAPEALPSLTPNVYFVFDIFHVLRTEMGVYGGWMEK
jgi:hypothetical protein